MEQYTIYCSDEQTKKAYELGAPIYVFDKWNSKAIEETKFKIEHRAKLDSGLRAENPTTEQMIGFFRSKNIHIVIHKDVVDKWSAYGHEIEPIEFTVFDRLNGYDSFEEAILAAIDAALDYLSKKK